MPTYEYRGVSPRLAAALTERAALEGRVAPRIDGRTPSRAPRLRADAISAQGRRALETAGYRSRASLAAFRMEVVDEPLGVDDLDAIHAELVRQAYAGVKGLTPTQRSFLAAHKVLPSHLDFVVPACGDGIAIPGITLRIPHRLREEIERLVDRDVLQDLLQRDGGRPPWGTRGPEPDPAPDVFVDLVRDPGGLLVRPSRERFEELLALDDGQLVQHADELLVGAQAVALDGSGGRALAVEAVRRLADLPVRRGDVDAAHMTQVLAPAIGLAATGASEDGWRIGEAARIARSAPPGTAVAELAMTAWQRAAHAEARMVRRVAKAAPGGSRAARRAVAHDRYVQILAGVDADGTAVAPALTTHGIAALTDVTRATYAALALPGANGVLPKDAPAGLGGRVMPPDPTWLVTRGGVTQLGSPGIGAMAFQALGAATQLRAPPCMPLGGDLFRFDWLLDEVREIADDLAHLDDLLLALLQHITDALEALKALGEEALERIAAVVEEIRRRAEALAAQIIRTVGDVVATATQAATMLGLVGWLSQWPHDQWAGLVGAVATAVGAGANPVTAAMDFIEAEVGRGLGAAVAPAVAEFRAFAREITDRIQETIVPRETLDALTRTLTDLLRLSGAGDPAGDARRLLQPIVDAGTAARRDLTDQVAGAIRALEALATSVRLSDELKALLLAWLVAPLVAALLAAAVVALSLYGAVAIGALISSALLAFGVNLLAGWAAGMLRALVVRVLADVLGLGRDLQAQARAGLQVALGQLVELQRLLTTAGQLDATLRALSDVISRTVEMLLPEQVEQLRAVLLSARDAVRRQLDPLVLALDRAFFRETLIPGASLAELETLAPSAPPPAPSRDVRNVAELFDALRLAPQLSSLLAQYESKRVATLPLLGARQELTHVLSLLDVLSFPSDDPSAPAPQPVQLQQLLGEVALPGGARLPAAGIAFTLAPSLFDRVAPGLHSQLVKDVALQIDFEPVLDEAALSVLADRLGEAAGGVFDPALASRATSDSLPGLPIVPLRFPTGVPAVLKQSCGSAVRVPPAVVAMFNGCTIGGPCDEPLPAEERPPSLVNVELSNDPNDGAQRAGYRLMTFRDGPATLMFSHFELTRDALRFIAEPKQLKAFEHRGVLGGWELEVPAVLRQFIAHDLPSVKDVRLVVSTSGQWDDGLKRALSAPPVATTLHRAATDLPATLDDLVRTVRSLLDAANLGNLIDLQQLLGLPSPGTAGNQIVPTLLSDSLLTNARAVLGGAPGTWTVTDVRRADGTVVPTAKIVRVLGARLGLTTNAALLGGLLPPIAGTLTFVDARGVSRTAPLRLADGLIDVPLSALGNPVSPIGSWTIDLDPLPAGLTVSALALTLFTEVAP